MNEETLKKASIDSADGIRRCGGSPDLYAKLLGMFIDDGNYAQACQAFETKDYEKLFSHVHEIKGMSGNLSMTKVYEDASNVVALLRAKDYDKIVDAFDKLTNSYADAIAAIEEALG